MRSIKKIVWGVGLVLIGVIMALRVLDICYINVFFDGWWTLFMIIPGIIGIVTEREKLNNVILTIIGVVLLLSCQDILPIGTVLSLIVPFLIVVIGIKLIFGGFNGSKVKGVEFKVKSEGVELEFGSAAFSEKNMSYDGKEFRGAELNAAFGSLSCDVLNGSIPSDCVVSACAVFGGIKLILPKNVNVKVKSTSVFGTVTEKIKRADIEGAVTVYVNGTAVFGGIDII